MTSPSSPTHSASAAQSKLHDRHHLPRKTAVSPGADRAIRRSTVPKAPMPKVVEQRCVWCSLSERRGQASEWSADSCSGSRHYERSGVRMLSGSCVVIHEMKFENVVGQGRQTRCLTGVSCVRARRESCYRLRLLPRELPRWKEHRFALRTVEICARRILVLICRQTCLTHLLLNRF